jgi:hypothetical protein
MLLPCLRKGAPWHLRYDVLIVSSNRLQLNAYLGLSVVNISMSSSLGSGWVCNRLLKPGRFVVDVFKDLSQQFFGNDGLADFLCRSRGIKHRSIASHSKTFNRTVNRAADGLLIFSEGQDQRSSEFFHLRLHPLLPCGVARHVGDEKLAVVGEGASSSFVVVFYKPFSRKIFLDARRRPREPESR